MEEQGRGDGFLPGDRPVFWAAVVLNLGIVAGLVIYAGLVLVPAARASTRMAAQVGQTQQDVAVQIRETERQVGQLRRRVSELQSENEEAIEGLLSEEEAVTALNNLYVHASRAGIRILSLENRPRPQPGADNLLMVSSYFVRAQGSLPDLLAFTASIEEAGSKGFDITSLHIAEVAEPPQLTMEFLLLTVAPGATPGRGD